MFTDDANMSDAALLVTVEELINRAIGPPNDNRIDFKLVQIILEILARQQRMLHQKIEIRIIELQDTKKKRARSVISESSSKSLRSVESTTTVTQKRKKSIENKTVLDEMDVQEKPRERQEEKEEGQNTYEDKSVVDKEKPKERTKEIYDTSKSSEKISVADKVVTVEKTKEIKKEKQDVEIKASEEKSVAFKSDIQKSPIEAKEVGIKASVVELQAHKADIKQKPIETNVREKNISDEKSVAGKVSLEKLKGGVKNTSKEKLVADKEEQPKESITENKNADIKASKSKLAADKLVTVEKTKEIKKEKQDVEIKTSEEKSVAFKSDIQKSPIEAKEVGIKASVVELQAHKADIEQKPIETIVREKNISDEKSVAGKVSVEKLKGGVKNTSKEKLVADKEEQPKESITENKNADIKASESKLAADKLVTVEKTKEIKKEKQDVEIKTSEEKSVAFKSDIQKSPIEAKEVGIKASVVELQAHKADIEQKPIETNVREKNISDEKSVAGKVSVEKLKGGLKNTSKEKLVADKEEQLNESVTEKKNADIKASESKSAADKVVTVEKTKEIKKEKQDVEIKTSEEKSVAFKSDIQKSPIEAKEVGIKASVVELQAHKADIEQKSIETNVREKNISDEKSVAGKVSVEKLKGGVKNTSKEKLVADKEEQPKESITENKNADLKASESKSVADKVNIKEKKEAEKITSQEKNVADNAYKSKDKKEQEKHERKEQKKGKFMSEKKQDDNYRQDIVQEIIKSEKEERKENVKEKKRPKEFQENGRLPGSVAKERLQTTGSSAIEITEKEIDKEKVLVIERGPTTHSDSRSPSGIDLVSRSQFELLKAAVEELSKVPFPKLLLLSENEELINDLKRGTATLSKTMQALQVNERLKSAEKSMTSIVDMLTMLASAGALPDEIAEQVETILPTMYEEAEKLGALPGIKSFGTPFMVGEGSQMSATPSEGPSTVNKLSATSVTTKVSCVTFMDMKVALQDLKNDVLMLFNKTIDKMSASAELSKNITKTVAEKLNIIQNLDSRISVLHSRVEEYTNYLNELGSVLETQFRQAEKQIAETHQNITNGILQLKNVNNNSEIAAVMAITEHYEDIEKKLDVINNEDKSLAMEQFQFISGMSSLMECMDMMRQEKVNRDVVLDRVSYKADTSQLFGLLTGSDFAVARNDFERRLDQCHKRFNRSVVTWAAVVKDLKHIKEKKLDLIDLLSERESTQVQLRDLNNKIRILTGMLGDPEVAIITRQLSVGATCGACHEQVHIELSDPTSKVPLKLPALRKTIVETPKISIPVWTSGQSVQRHICHRWCGGSHTTVDPKNHIQLHLQMQEVPTKKYNAYGEDGRLYKFEEELKPCFDCNALSEKMTQEPVRGDIEGRINPET